MDDVKSIRMSQLNTIWSNAGSKTASLKSGVKLWHGGLIENQEMIDDNKALWCTNLNIKKGRYDGFARNDSQKAKKEPYRLTLKIKKDLNLADFDGKSLFQFTSDYCDCKHDTMKDSLREWCLNNSFDGVININNSHDEVVICRPGTVLKVLCSAPL